MGDKLPEPSWGATDLTQRTEDDLPRRRQQGSDWRRTLEKEQKALLMDWMWEWRDRTKE